MESEGAFVRALGSHFKLTEVYIWEDGSTETREVRLFPESTSKFLHDFDENNLNFPDSISDISRAPEDVELTKEMDALGLPLSFQSNKETRNKMNKTKKKGTRLKPSHGHKEAKDEALGFSQASEVEIVSPTVFHDKTSNSLSCVSMMGQSESYYYDVAADLIDSCCPADEDRGSSAKIISGAVIDGSSHNLSNNGKKCEFVTLSADANLNHDEQEFDRSVMEYDCLGDSSVSSDHQKSREVFGDNSIEQAGVSDLGVLSQNSEVLGHSGVDGHRYINYPSDWTVCWDTFYMRNFFHNIKTSISTWDPPTDMEHLAFGDATDGANEVIADVAENDDGPSASWYLQNHSESLEEPSKDSVMVDQLSDQVSIGVVVNASNSLPETTKQTENNSCELQDKLHGITASCDDEVTSCLSLDAQEHIGSLTAAINEKATDDDNKQMEIADPATDKLDAQRDAGMKKQKKKARKMRAHRISSNANEELQYQDISEDLSINIGKYWCQRYLLFSRFDSGVKMDEEGWFSVTPEPIARHHALRCVSDSIIDCFTGVGGNAIQFAQTCKHVTAIDIDPKKIDYAYHNAAIYGVDDQIDFIMGNFFILAPRLKADTVFLSPPWGGPDYVKAKTYDVMTMLKPHDGYSLFSTAKKIARRIIMFLPRNVDLNQLAELSLSAADHPWSLEVEKNFLNGKLKAITAYFSDTGVDVNKSP